APAAFEPLEARLVRGLLRRLQVEATPHGVSEVRLSGRPSSPSGASARRLVEQARAELQDYWEGGRSYFSVPVDLRGAARFQHRVLDAAARIPFGESRSYSWIARTIGHPRAGRAWGTAL